MHKLSASLVSDLVPSKPGSLPQWVVVFEQYINEGNCFRDQLFSSDEMENTRTVARSSSSRMEEAKGARALVI